MQDFSYLISEWYSQNKRDLPWRNTKDPYLIWLSEIILQQTRVDQGIAYYHKFASIYPDVKKLGAASEGEILKLWQGLGYYSRARNLHFAAKELITRHHGVFPKDFASISKLKGIGEYTASAIASFAFDLPYSVVDGNVYRLLSRVFGINTPIDSEKGKKQFRELAGKLLNLKNPALHNQAIMEMGALQCIPKNPVCTNCPLQSKCVALLESRVDQLPVKEKKILKKNRHFTFFLIREKNKIWLEKRTGKDIWQNLFQLPMLETEKAPGKSSFTMASQKLTGGSGKLVKITGPVKHILTHQNISAYFVDIKLDRPVSPPGSIFKAPLEKINEYAIPRLVENYLSEHGIYPAKP